MENLDRYIKGQGITRRAFANRVGIHPSMITRLIQGACLPSLDLAAAIERETSGAVSAVSWVSRARHVEGPGEQGAAQ